MLGFTPLTIEQIDALFEDIMAAERRASRSPYQKYEKKPYTYSVELRNWRKAIIDNNKKASDEWDAAWHTKYGLYRHAA